MSKKLTFFSLSSPRVWGSGICYVTGTCLLVFTAAQLQKFDGDSRQSPVTLELREEAGFANISLLWSDLTQWRLVESLPTVCGSDLSSCPQPSCFGDLPVELLRHRLAYRGDGNAWAELFSVPEDRLSSILDSFFAESSQWKSDFAWDGFKPFQTGSIENIDGISLSVVVLTKQSDRCLILVTNKSTG